MTKESEESKKSRVRMARHVKKAQCYSHYRWVCHTFVQLPYTSLMMKFTSTYSTQTHQIAYGMGNRYTAAL